MTRYRRSRGAESRRALRSVPHVTRSAMPVMLVPLLTLGACSDPPQLRSTVFRDSGGVQIVENHSLAASGAAASAILLAESRTFPVGEDGAVQGLVLLENGHVVLASGITKSLVWMDSGGNLLGRTGRGGDGPGEFHGFGGLFRCHGDTLVVISPPARLTTMTARGDLVTVEDRPALRRGGYGVSGDCSMVLILEVTGSGVAEAGRGGDVALSWYSRHRGTMSGIASVQPHPRAAVEFQGVRLPLPVPFSTASVWAVGGHCTYVGSSAEPSIQVYNRHGRLIRILRWNATPAAVTDEDRALYEQDRADALALFGPAAQATLPPLSAFPTISEKPYYRRLLADDAGYLWVEIYPSRWDGFERMLGPESQVEERSWWVFAPSGRLLGEVTTPAHATIYDIREGLAVAVSTKADGLETVLTAKLRDDLWGTVDGRLDCL